MSRTKTRKASTAIQPQPHQQAAPVNRLLQSFSETSFATADNTGPSSVLKKAILSQLEFPHPAAKGFSSHGAAVRDYVRAVSELNRLQRDLLDVFVASLMANVSGRYEGEVHHDEQLQQAKEEKVRQLVKQVPFEPAPVRSRLTVELTQGPVGQLVATLQQDIVEGASTVATRFLQSLEAAFERRLLGRIEWVGPTGCNFTFFKWVIIQTEVTETRGNVPVSMGPVQENGLAEFRYQRHIRGAHEHREAIHLYGLMDAKAFKYPSEGHPMPEDVRSCFDSVAPWLRSMIRYVDGTQIRALVVERDVAREQWQDVKVERVLARPVYRLDPALTIFGYVLTGWTDAEQREAVRQHRLQSRSEEVRGFFNRLFNGR